MTKTKIMCLICETTYDEGDQCAIESKHSGALYGVCDDCRRYAELGRLTEANMKKEAGIK